MANGVGIARGLLHGLNIYDQMQQRAIERRLMEQQTAPVDLLPLLPDRVRASMFPGAQSLMAPRDIAGSVYGGILHSYEPSQATLNTLPRITPGLAEHYGLPSDLVGQPASVVRDLGIRLEAPQSSGGSSPMIDPLMLRDYYRALETGDWSTYEQQWGGTQIPASALGSFTLAPGRTAEAIGAIQHLGLLDRPIGPLVARQIQQQTGLEIDPQATLRQLQATYGGADWLNQLIALAEAPAQRESIQTRTQLTEAQLSAQQLQNRLLEMFGEPERRASLQRQLADAARAQLGVEMDQAQLDRFLQLTEPTVARAVAEAEQAGLDLRFRQDTYDDTVARVRQELQNLIAQGQLTQEELDRFQQLTPLVVQQYQEELAQQRLQTQRQELENQLLQEFGRAERQARLDAQLLATARDELGLEMDEAQIERFRQLTGPTVARAVAEAAQSQLDLVFTQETFEAMVEQVNQELANLRTQGKLSEAEYDRYVQLTPHVVSQAQEELVGIVIDNEMRQLELQAARQTFSNRVAQVALQTQLLDVQIQQAQVALEQARQNLVLARRLGPVQEEQAQLEVQRLQEQIAQMQQERMNLERQSQVFGGLNPEDRDFAFKMYQAETEPFEGAGIWVPPYIHYVENLMSGQPLDWNQYVMEYNRQMEEQLGPAPRDGAPLPWLASEWQTGYRTAYDSYYKQFPELSIDQVPRYPPIEVWYANQISENPLPEDELIARWNNGILRIGNIGNASVESVAQFMVNQSGGNVEQLLRELDAATEEQKRQFENEYGVSIAEIAQYLILGQLSR